MKRFSFILSAFVALIFPLFVQANDFNVKDFDDPSPRGGACLTAAAPCSLREALIAANGAGAGPHNIFLISGQTYTLSISDKIPDPAKMPPEITDEDNALTGDLDLKNDINILTTGNEQAIVTAASGFVGRIFHLPNNNIVKISNLIIQKGSITNMNGGGISNGGGVGNNGGNLTLTNVTLQNNSAKSTTGGGLNNSGRAITTLENCIIKLNDAAQGGGGIYNEGSNSLTINNSKIFANIASYAGGLLSFGKLTLNHVEISSNNATASGSTAGITISGNEATINHSHIFNNLNTADNSITNVTVTVHENLTAQATLTMNNSTVTSSSTQTFSKCVNVLNAGGKLNLNQNTLKLDSTTCSNKGIEINISEWVKGADRFQPLTTLTNNTLSDYNVGVFADTSINTTAKVTIQQSTFNSVASAAEAIRVDSATANNLIELKNSILGNTCSYITGTTPLKTSGFNLEKTATCLPLPLGTNDQQNISDFKFGNSGNLGNNGGMTQNYSLLAGSPAIDKGDCTGLTDPTDQRGIARPKGNGCDIGSFEATSTSEVFSFSSTSLDFKQVQINKTKTLPIEIRNISNLPVTFPNATIIPSPNSSYTIDLSNCIGSTLQPMDQNSFCSIGITFNPKLAGIIPGTITVPANFFVLSNSDVSFQLTGEGTTDTPPPLLAPQISLDQTILKFPTTKVGQNSSTNLTIQNIGNKALILQSISFEGDQQSNFKFTGCENKTIDPQKNCILNVSFIPQANGSFTAKLIIVSNSPSNGRTEVALSGDAGGAVTVVTANNQSSGCNLLATSDMNLFNFLFPLFSILGIGLIRKKNK